MRYAALFYGVVIYALMFLLWSGFVLYGLAQNPAAHIVGLVSLVVLAIAAARQLRLHNWRDILPYSLAWFVTIALLDALFAVPYSGWTMYADWNLWVGYAIVLLIPLLVPYFRRSNPGVQMQAV